MSLSDKEAAAIAEIHEQDVAEARALLREAIRTASERWLPMSAVVDAMVRELVVMRGRSPCVVALKRTTPQRGGGRSPNGPRNAPE